jgi:hypothetical protein
VLTAPHDWWLNCLVAQLSSSIAIDRALHKQVVAA